MAAFPIYKSSSLRFRDLSREKKQKRRVRTIVTIRLSATGKIIPLPGFDADYDKLKKKIESLEEELNLILKYDRFSLQAPDHVDNNKSISKRIKWYTSTSERAHINSRCP